MSPRARHSQRCSYGIRDRALLFDRDHGEVTLQEPPVGIAGLVARNDMHVKMRFVLPERERHEHYSRQAVPADMLVPEIY